MSDERWALYRVHLNDEIPGIGSGERLVEARTGTKWAYVRRHSQVDNRKAKRVHRLRVSAWAALHPEEQK